MRGLRICFVCFVLLSVGASAARADGDLAKTVELALENYDLADYDAAKKQLEGALADAEGDKATIARGHLALAAVYHKLGNSVGAKASIARALSADETVRPEDRYDKAFVALFESVVAEAEASTSCEGLAALSHNRGQPAKAGKPYELSCLAGNSLGDIKLVAFYRTDSAAAFAKLEMTKSGECTWTAQVPAVSGEQLEYHFAAVNASGVTVAAHGSAASPIAVVIEAAAETPPPGRRAEDEVPDELGGKPPKPRGNGCAGCSQGGAGGANLSLLLVCALLAGLRRNRLST